MIEQQQSLRDISHIKNMMERSSRFISLSGWSGVSAGICALIGAWVAHPYVMGRKDFRLSPTNSVNYEEGLNFSMLLNNRLFWIAVITFIAALISAFIFTYLKSRKDKSAIWGKASQRLLFNVCLPIVVGGIFILKLTDYGTFYLVAPACLLFYGLALINASKYTLVEIRYLGYAQILLGLINMAFVGYGIYFWAIGFGLLHILYGLFMWKKYELTPDN